LHFLYDYGPQWAANGDQKFSLATNICPQKGKTLFSGCRLLLAARQLAASPEHDAQCKGEGVSGPVLTDGKVYGSVAQARKETTLIDTCMARNGYIQTQR
jgi:hypothetical protein